jgi:hypothetical protein
MNPARVEAWALQAIDRIKTRQPNEDSRVECKRIWIAEYWEVARQLAGSANAARGDMVLWLIGVDEVDGLVGVPHEELSNWYAQVRAQFADGAAPTILQAVNVTDNGQTAVALLFETDRAPYVVKLPRGGRDTPGGGKVTLEVPWREGNSTRTATHADLIRLLVSLQRRPDVEILDGKLTLYATGQDKHLYWSLLLNTYFIPQMPGRLTIPFHHCQAKLTIPGYLENKPGSELKLQPLYFDTGMPRVMTDSTPAPRPLSETIKGTVSEVHIDGSGQVQVTANWTAPRNMEATFDVSARLVLHLKPVYSDYVLTINIDLRAVPPHKPAEEWHWRVASSPVA